MFLTGFKADAWTTKAKPNPTIALLSSSRLDTFGLKLRYVPTEVFARHRQIGISIRRIRIRQEAPHTNIPVSRLDSDQSRLADATLNRCWR